MKPTTSLYPVIQQCQVYFFYCNLKEKYHIRRIINSKKKRYFICEICIIILTYQKLRPVGPVQQSIKLPSPKPECNMLDLAKLCGMLEAKESKGSKRYFFLAQRVFTREISSRDEYPSGLKSSLSMVKCLLLFTNIPRMTFHPGMN